MITETENAPSWAPVVVVGLVAAALGSALLFDPPLESQRPSNPSAVLEAPQHRQFPLARLWQDPLHAVYAHWNAAGAPWESIPFVTDAAVCGRDFLRLLVMMPGTPYSNDRETRRRQRHAVVSALTSRDFVPGDETRLRYFHAPPFRQPSDAAAAGSSNNDPTLSGTRRTSRRWRPSGPLDFGRGVLAEHRGLPPVSPVARIWSARSSCCR